MNPVLHGPSAEKRKLARRLNELTKDFRFCWGRPANRGDQSLCIALDRRWDENDQLEYLVSIFAADTPRKFLCGLPWTVRQATTEEEIVVEGQTDRHGCFWLRGLPEGEYTVELGVEVLPAGGKLKRGQIPELLAYLAVSAREPVFEKFHSAAVRAAVRSTPSGELVLEAQVDIEGVSSAPHVPSASDQDEGVLIVARFQIYAQQPTAEVAEQPTAEVAEQKPSVTGYVGLYRDGGGTAVGRIFLNRLPDRIQAVSDTYFIQVSPVHAAELTPADRADLQRSRDASEGPSQEVLDVLLRQLGTTEE